MLYQEYLRELAKRYKQDHKQELNTAIEMSYFRNHLTERVKKVLMSQNRENIIRPFPFELPGDELIKGKYHLSDVYGTLKPVMVNDEDITHFLTCGKTGTGKTTVTSRLSTQIIQSGGVVWFFEFMKREVQNLIRIIPNLYVLLLEKFKQNIFQKFHGLSSSRSSQIVNEIISSIMGLMTASSGFLMRCQDQLDEIFRKAGKGAYFCISDLIDYMKAIEPKRGTLEHDYWERVLIRLEKTYRSVERYPLVCSSGFPVKELEEYNIDFNGMGLDLESAEIVYTRLILDVYLRRIFSKDRNYRPLYICIDDAHLRLFDREREKFGAKHLLTMIPNVSREVDMIFMVNTQSPKHVSDSILENSSKLLLNLTDIRDLDLIAKSIGLSAEEKEYCYEQKTREGILKLISDKWTKPIPVKIPYFEIPKDVTNEEAEEHSRDFIEEMNRYVKPRSTILIEKLKKDKARELTKEEEEYLSHINKFPFRTEEQHKKGLGLSNYKSNKISKSLVIKGYVVKKRFYTGKPGNQPVLQELTGKGKNYLVSIGIRVPKGKGKGGIIHQKWAQVINEFWKEKGMEVFIEPNENGANTDVLVIDSDGKRTAIEIALSRDGQIKNILRDLEYFDRVIMAVETRILLENIKAEAQKSINGNHLKRIRFCLLQEFLN